MTKEEAQTAREIEWERLIRLVDSGNITIHEANRRFDAWVACTDAH